MRTTVYIQNLKCDGCKNTLQKKLTNIEGISKVEVDVAQASVRFDYTTSDVMGRLRVTLKEMGYPITGDANTFINKATSYVSCALGKMSTPK